MVDICQLTSGVSLAIALLLTVHFQMLPKKFFQLSQNLGLEFWLSLPLLGISFWLICGLLTQYKISSFQNKLPELQITQSEKLSSQTIISIKLEMNRDRGTSLVSVKTLTRKLNQSQFELPSTEISQIVNAIGRELQIPPRKVKKLLIVNQ